MKYVKLKTKGGPRKPAEAIAYLHKLVRQKELEALRRKKALELMINAEPTYFPEPYPEGTPFSICPVGFC